MHAVRVAELSGPLGLRLELVPDPVRSQGEVLVDVDFVAPAFPDLLMCQGAYQFQPALPYTPGSDFAGVVRESDAGGRFTPGDRVAGMVDVGAAAEQVLAPEDRLFPVPDDLALDVAAALPLNYLTAHFALVTRASLLAGEWVLVRGAAGGLGIAATQVARALGANVIAVASTPQKRETSLSAGAQAAFEDGEGLPDAVRRTTDGRGADVVVDLVGGDLTSSLRSLAPLGRLLAVGFTSGEIPVVKVNRLLLRNCDIRGVEWGYMLEAGRAQTQWEALLELRRAGWIRPVVAPAGTLGDFASSLAALSGRHVVGRQVLSVRPGS